MFPLSARAIKPGKRGDNPMSIEQAKKQLAFIEAEIAALEADKSERGLRIAAVRLPKMRLAADQGRAWIAANAS
jgi:hypothetical protein